METTTCRFCAAHDAATAARQTYGRTSAEYRSALVAVGEFSDLARVGRAHDSGCRGSNPVALAYPVS